MCVFLCPEHQNVHGCRADQRFLPCCGVFKPPRWFLPPHPVCRAGRDEAQHRPNGLACELEAVQRRPVLEEFYRCLIFPSRFCADATSQSRVGSGFRTAASCWRESDHPQRGNVGAITLVQDRAAQNVAPPVMKPFSCRDGAGDHDGSPGFAGGQERGPLPREPGPAG